MGRPSPFDDLSVEALGVDVGEFRNFTSFALMNSIVAPHEASFELGDLGSFQTLRELTSIGTEFRVKINGRPRLTGRVEVRDTPLDASKSSVIRFVVRTKLADAKVASADPRIRITKQQTVEEFVVRAYSTIGVSEDQFLFADERTARNLLTGRPASSPKTGSAEAIVASRADQAKPRPPETVYATVDRHLRRFGLMHWESPDGKIVVGQPNDIQDPTFRFVCNRTSRTEYNNCQSINQKEDVGTSATILGVYGIGGGRLFSKAKVSATLANETLVAGNFNRPVLIVDEGIKTKVVAERRVKREVANRNRSLDSLAIRVDGFSQMVGGDRVNFAPDTVIDVESEIHGGALGAYYVESVGMNRGLNGDTTEITAVRRGVWLL